MREGINRGEQVAEEADLHLVIVAPTQYFIFQSAAKIGMQCNPSINGTTWPHVNVEVVIGGRGTWGERGYYWDWRVAPWEMMGAIEIFFFKKALCIQICTSSNHKKTKAKIVQCSGTNKICPPATALPKLLWGNTQATNSCTIGSKWGWEVINNGRRAIILAENCVLVFELHF
jgi:hypothetical protein